MEQTHKNTILVVEDHEAYRRALVDSLKKAGLDSIAAEDGEEGLAVALKSHPDLIVLDMQMPKMDGIEMLKRLRTDSWGKDAKVIVLTAFADSGKIAQVMDLQTFDYVVKTDIRNEQLVEKIKERLSR